MENFNNSETDDIDESYWRKAILQRHYYRGEVAFDRYRWALRYGMNARKRHGEGVNFEQLEKDLAAGWVKFGGPSGLSWAEARDAVRDSWDYADTLAAEEVARRGGFRKPPTFTEQGAGVPRNIDEPNS